MIIFDSCPFLLFEILTLIKKKRLSDFSTEDLTYNISVSAILSIQYQSNQISELTLYICGNKELSHVLP